MKHANETSPSSHAITHLLELIFFSFGGGFTVATDAEWLHASSQIFEHSRTALMASSNTVLRPFCVSAEHSRYLTALMSFAIPVPMENLTGVILLFHNMSRAFSTSLVKTRLTGR